MLLKVGPCLFLLLCLIGLPAEAGVDVLFLPDTGFLRVESEFTIEPISSQLSFILFPQAQITSFWIDGLQDYQVERGFLGTIITFTIADYSQPQTLVFSYEGFLTPDPASFKFDRDTLWFPEFSFPIRTPSFQVQIPQGWSLFVPEKLEAWEQGSDQIFSWRPLSSAYPHFTVLRDRTPLPPGPEIAAQTEELGQTPFSRELKDESARAEELLFLFTTQVNARNTEELDKMFSTQLQKRGLAQYLSAFPEHYGTFSAEFLQAPQGLEKPLSVIFTAEKGQRFRGTMLWTAQQGQWQLKDFSLAPYFPPVAPELQASLTGFVHKLSQAIRTKTAESVTKFVALPEEQQDKAVAFLLSLNPRQRWSLEYIALEPLAITILIPHSRRTTLLLNLRLVPGTENWLIDSKQCIPGTSVVWD